MKPSILVFALLWISASAFAEQNKIIGGWKGIITENCSAQSRRSIPVEILVEMRDTGQVVLRFGGDWQNRIAFEFDLDGKGNILGRSGFPAGYLSSHELYFTKDANISVVDVFTLKNSGNSALFFESDSYWNTQTSCQYSGDLQGI